MCQQIKVNPDLENVFAILTWKWNCKLQSNESEAIRFWQKQLVNDHSLESKSNRNSCELITLLTQNQKQFHFLVPVMLYNISHDFWFSRLCSSEFERNSLNSFSSLIFAFEYNRKHSILCAVQSCKVLHVRNVLWLTEFMI